MRIISFALTLLLAAAGSFSRAQSLDTTLTNKYLLDFSVPDMPAFKALGADPSNILRPSDIQKFAASFSPFYSNGQGVIPKNFALEFAPWKLGSKNWTLKKYNTGGNSLLYNSGFSIGTIRDSSSYASKLSFGYRLTITSKKGDILKAVYDRHFSNSLTRQFRSIQTGRFLALTEMKTYWIYTVRRLSRATSADSVDSYFTSNIQAFYTYIKSLWGTVPADTNLSRIYESFINQFHINITDDLDRLINEKVNLADEIASAEDSVISKFKSSMWNANRLDLAIAWVGESKDTLVKNSQFSSLNIWTTYAIGIGQSCQLLLGGNLILPRTEKNDSVKTNTAYALNARFYAGTRNVRGFIESQYKYQNYTDLKKSLLFNLGGEFRIGRQFWVVANAGIDNYLGLKNPLSVLVSSLNLRYGFNDAK